MKLIFKHENEAIALCFLFRYLFPSILCLLGSSYLVSVVIPMLELSKDLFKPSHKGCAYYFMQMFKTLITKT